MKAPYKNRQHAGQILAALLAKKNFSPADSIVLALPRGGVPVAYEIAIALKLPLDVFIVRKLGVPFYDELAMGAITSGGGKYLNQKIIRQFKIAPEDIKKVEAKELQELTRREHLYRGKHTSSSLKNKTVILVDDGIATGATMYAVLMALHKFMLTKIIIAVPVAAIDSCELLAPSVKEILCPYQVKELNAVGAWYENFLQTEDEEVSALLRQARELQ